LKFTDPTGQFPFLIGLAISMAVSGGMAAATGGNIIKAMVMGALTYCVGFGVSQVVGGFEVCGWGLTATGSAMVGGAAGGALSAVMTGGAPLMGAAMGAASVGAAGVLGEVLPGAFKWIGDVYIESLAVSTAAGALIGGVTAEVMGGGFGEGAAYGAASAAAGHIGGVVLLMIDIRLNPEKYLDLFRRCCQMNIAEEASAVTGLAEAGAIMARALATAGGAAAADGPIIPVGDLVGAGILIAATAVAIRTVDWDAVMTKVHIQIARLLSVNRPQMGWQYTLRATRNGVYFTRRGNPVLLRVGDVYKIGETMHPPGSGPNQRYSWPALTARGLYWRPEFYGNKTQ
jgi:hypothetical protein